MYGTRAPCEKGGRRRDLCSPCSTIMHTPSSRRNSLPFSSFPLVLSAVAFLLLFRLSLQNPVGAQAPFLVVCVREQAARACSAAAAAAAAATVAPPHSTRALYSLPLPLPPPPPSSPLAAFPPLSFISRQSSLFGRAALPPLTTQAPTSMRVGWAGIAGPERRPRMVAQRGSRSAAPASSSSSSSRVVVQTNTTLLWEWHSFIPTLEAR